MKKIAIIGAGVTGLTLGYRLLKEGYDVSIYERNTEVAGQLYAIPVEGIKTEIYYHHTFMSDTNFIELCEELKVDEKLEWLDSSMAYYSDGVQYPFGTPFDLLKFSPLKFLDKIKFVISILRLQQMKDISHVNKFAAKEWFVKNGYENVWDVIWEPLFKLKFAELSDEISLVWLWDKLIKRGKSRGGAKEKLCYMNGSFFEIAAALKKNILNMNGNIYLDTVVDSITQDDNSKFNLVVNGQNSDFDVVISTLSSEKHAALYEFSDKHKSNTKNYKYQSAICALLVLNDRFSDFYWTNIGDYEIPFGGIIEHSNFVGEERYNGKTIIYLSKYLSKECDFYSKSDEDILSEFYTGLKKVNKNFSEDCVLESHIFKEADAQPIVKKGYVSPKVETEVENFYWLSTHHVYPHDRGIEYGIEQANYLAKKIQESEKKSKSIV